MNEMSDDDIFLKAVFDVKDAFVKKVQKHAYDAWCYFLERAYKPFLLRGKIVLVAFQNANEDYRFHIYRWSRFQEMFKKAIQTGDLNSAALVEGSVDVEKTKLRRGLNDARSLDYGVKKECKSQGVEASDDEITALVDEVEKWVRLQYQPDSKREETREVQKA